MPLTSKYRPSGAILIAAGAVLGLGLIVFGLLRLGARQEAPRSAESQAFQRVSNLVTAARAVQRGQVIRPADLKTTPVVGAPPPNAITSPANVAGKVAIVDIQPQQLILTGLVSDDPAAAGLAMLVPAGQRVLSIDTTDEIAVGGFLRPGDVVDIEIVLPQDVFGGGAQGPDRSESRTLLQNIKVVTVGPTLGQPEDKLNAPAGQAAPASRSLTLAMLPEQVGPFTLARKLGHFYLLLRNPGDRAIVPAHRAGLANLRGGESGTALAPGAAVSRAASRRSAPSRPVELIVGGQRQIIYPGTGGR